MNYLLSHHHFVQWRLIVICGFARSGILFKWESLLNNSLLPALLQIATIHGIDMRYPHGIDMLSPFMKWILISTLGVARLVALGIFLPFGK